VSDGDTTTATPDAAPPEPAPTSGASAARADAAPAKPRRWRRWGTAVRRRFVEHYMTIDARSLGLGRIVLAVVMLVDLIRRIPDITLFYSNLGLVPNHMMLWRPPTQWMFSFFFILSLPDEVAFGFLFCGLVYLALLVGWRTRLMQVLALICVLSLHGRVTLMENGGDWMLGELAMWTAFLPLGRRFSLDAFRDSLRRRRETTVAELEDRAALAPAGHGAPIVALAAAALILQLANAYIFNAAHKGGITWRQGTAVHYVLHQDRMVTWFAVFMRPYMGLWLSRILSWSSLATEAILPVLLLLPVGARARVWTRRAAVLAIIGLHTGFQCFINLGVFSWAMIAYTPFLLTAADWELFTQVAARNRRRLVAYFDAGCGVCFQLVRGGARLDRFHRVRFVSSAEAPPELSPDVLAATILVVDETTGRRYTRADAVAQILRAFPVGWLWSLPLRLPGLRQLANWGYGLFARRRERISIGLGLAACSLPQAAIPVESASPAAPMTMMAPTGPSPARRRWRFVVSALREGFVLALIVTMVSETLFINAAIPKLLKHEQPGWIKRLVAYPRFIQAWSMFSSDAPMTDLNMVVDAITVDGRHVDPYSESAGRYPNPGRTEVPVRMDNDSLIFNYSGRIPDNPAYHQALTEWILRYPERTGRTQDHIVRFDCYLVEDDSPPIGEMNPRNVRTRLFLSHPHR
jgi:predicted DCC family thiol-disulfide oxidoreductase YuxK